MENENEKLIKIDENEYKVTSDIDIEDFYSNEKIVDNNDFEYSLKGLYDYITTRNTKELGMLLLRFVIVLIIILLCKFPFELLKDLGYSIFDLFNGNISIMFLKIWHYTCEIGYYVFGIYAFIKIITKRYDNLIKNKIVNKE